MKLVKHRAVLFLLALAAASASAGVARVHSAERSDGVVVAAVTAPIGFSDGTDAAVAVPSGFSDGTDGFSDGTDGLVAPG
jgi:hypothetical protein